MSRNRRGFGSLVNGTTYNDRADPRVVQILEAARQSGRRICVRHGDRATGRDWGDMRMCGKIGRSMGPQKIPLLIASSRSMGGPGLLEDVIVQITESGTKRKLYEVPGYHKSTEAEDYASTVNHRWRSEHGLLGNRRSWR